MELYKRSENYKDPVKIAKRNFIALSFLYIVLILLFFGTRPQIAYYLIPLAILLLVASYFLQKRSMAGVYLGWAFVILGVGASFLNGALLTLVIVAYLGYWNYKAAETLKQQGISN